MSIRIHQLTKVYGSQKAVDNISFEVGEGEIVGFLGPNGAGKSTTMKIATGYIPPTSGLVNVGGYDVVANPRKTKQIIGYLPEHNPLYTDMYVREYLAFAGGLYGLRGAPLKARIAETIELCGLAREQHKKIEALSKGYRQRVGLAQALIHDPAVLILDEPTSGLDPNQLADIRKLIRRISLNKTVIFSTHIMQEVEAICDRVIVINRGVIVADDSLSHLISTGRQNPSVIAEFDQPVDPDLLRSLPGVTEVQIMERNAFRIIGEKGHDVRAVVFRFAADNQRSLIGLKQEDTSLESVFQHLTR